MAAPARRCRCASIWPGADGVAVIDCADGESGCRPSTACGRKASSPALVGGRREPFAYRLRFSHGGDTWEAEDPYRFPLILGEMDIYLIGEGSHRRLYERLGAHPMTLDGVAGVAFAVWAPNASRVSVVGDFNQWDGRRHPMRKRIEAGVWELFIPGVAKGAIYKFELLGRRWPPAAAQGRSVRLPVTSCRRPPARASTACRATNGPTTTGWRTARRGRRSTRPSRSTRSTSAHGGARTDNALLDL